LEKLFSANHTLRFNINVTVRLYFSQIDHAFKQVYLNVLIMSTLLKRDYKLSALDQKQDNAILEHTKARVCCWKKISETFINC
jgi:hypothetical protein